MNKIKVTNPFAGQDALRKLTADFRPIKVNSQYLKLNLWRRFVRDIETQLNVSPAVFGNDSDEEDFFERLKNLLEGQGFNTVDLDKTIIVIGNHSGVLSGATFNIANAERLYTDLTAYENDYPIFLDTSATRILLSDRDVEDLKRGRSDGDETLQFLPSAKKAEIETIQDIQAQWLEQQDQYKKQIEALQTRVGKVMEHNAELTELCTQREKELVASLDECSKKTEDYERATSRLENEIRTLKTEPMSMTNSPSFITTGLEEEPTQRVTADQTMRTPERPVKPKVGSRLSGLFGNIGLFDPLIENEDQEIKQQTNRSITLAKFGLTNWNPETTSFYDYFDSFEAVVLSVRITHQEYISLLFSALPSKYSFLKSVVVNHKDFKKNDSATAVKILVQCLMGNDEKRFLDFQKLQRKPNQSFLEFYQSCKTRFQWYHGDNIENDANAFRVLKDKMVKAYPTMVAQEFKRRLEGKTTLTDIFNAILAVNDNNPNIEDERSNDGEIYALKMKNEDWQKTVRCYGCGRMGHIRRNCKQREKKTKRSGRKDE